MDKVGKGMHYSCIIHVGEWALGGRVDSTVAGSEARMSTCTYTICAGGRCRAIQMVFLSYNMPITPCFSWKDWWRKQVTYRLC